MIYIKEYNLFDQLPLKPDIEDIKIGDQMILKQMAEEKDPVAPGTRGEVIKVQPDINIIEVKWENGRTLSVLYDIDEFEIF